MEGEIMEQSALKREKPVIFTFINITASIWDWIISGAIVLGMAILPIALYIYFRANAGKVAGRIALEYACQGIVPIGIMALVLFWIRLLDPENRRRTVIIFIPGLLSNIGAMAFGEIPDWFAYIAFSLTVVLVAWFYYFRYPPHYWSAIKQLRAYNYDRALQFANQAIETRPKSSDAYQLRAIVHYSCKQASEAEQDARLALQLNPNSCSSRGMLGGALMLQGRYSEAKQAHAEVLRQVPRYVTSHWNFGYACYRLGEFQLAAQALTTATKTGLPTAQSNLFANYLLGKSLEALGQRPQAEKAYKKMFRHRRGVDKHKAWIQDAPELPEIVKLREELADMESRLNPTG
jgi:tetratricopeptide (TPR) repeat protein